MLAGSNFVVGTSTPPPWTSSPILDLEPTCVAVAVLELLVPAAAGVAAAATAVVPESLLGKPAGGVYEVIGSIPVDALDAAAAIAISRFVKLLFWELTPSSSSESLTPSVSKYDIGGGIGDGSCSLLFLRLLRRKSDRKIRKAMRAMPPSTPPMIAPIGVDLWEVVRVVDWEFWLAGVGINMM